MVAPTCWVPSLIRLRALATERHVRAPACPEREGHVPRYFFHVRDGQSYLDAEGSELSDLDAVRAEALHASGDMLRGLKDEAGFWSGHDWTMKVQDEAGKDVLTLRFSGTEHV